MTTVSSPFEKVRSKMVAARIECMGQLAKFSTEQLAQRPTENDWSALHIAYHLYVTDGLALEMIRRIQAEENPLISDLRQDAPRATAADDPQTLDVILAGMAARREEIFQFLSELPDEAWERPYRHPEWGERKFFQLLNGLAQHDQQHAQQLAALKTQLEEK